MVAAACSVGPLGAPGGRRRKHSQPGLRQPTAVSGSRLPGRGLMKATAVGAARMLHGDDANLAYFVRFGRVKVFKGLDFGYPDVAHRLLLLAMKLWEGLVRWRWRWRNRNKGVETRESGHAEIEETMGAARGRRRETEEEERACAVGSRSCDSSRGSRNRRI